MGRAARSRGYDVVVMWLNTGRFVVVPGVRGASDPEVVRFR